MSVVCSICLDSLLSSTSVGLDCGHIYHQSCINDWKRMKSSCPICKATLKKKGKDKVIFFSTNDASSSETGPPDQRVVEENEGLKTRVKKLNESVTEKDREILRLKEKQIQQNTTLQYLKQLKRVAELDDDLAKPTSRALFESMMALPREELVCALSSLKSRLKSKKRETDKLAHQLQKSNKIIEEFVEDIAQKERELRRYREKYPEDITENDAESSTRPKKRKRTHPYAGNGLSRAPSTSSIKTRSLASISLRDDDDDDDDDTDDGRSSFAISDHIRGTDLSSTRHILDGCRYCRGVPSLPNDIESTRQGRKCISCDRRLLYPNESTDDIMMMNTSTPTIDVDAENSSRNQRVCIVLSDDEGDDDSTSDEM